MEDKTYEVDKMLNTLIDLAKEEVDKAKQRGYFGKDIVEPATMVIALANEKYGMGGYGTYGNRRNDYPGYGAYGRGNYGYGNYGYGNQGGYGNEGGYGNHEEYEQEGYGNGTGASRRGERYGRSGERYG